MNKHIKKVAVLGSGVMGSRIACHFANVGVEVLLLDISPKELNDQEKAKKLALDHPSVKNRIVNEALQNTLKTNPSPIYSKAFVTRITTGNFDDDMSKIAACDWIIEVVVENLNIKKTVFEQVEKYRKPGSFITSNTSGIPIHLMLDGRSDDFQQYFCGTHFFNPPRYLPLLEIIPTAKTKSEVINFLMHYGQKFLGKKTVLAKDTPAFIANRVGVFSIMQLFHTVKEMGLTVTEVDKLTGPILGRPKSATFRTCDVVGLDTLVNVAKGLAQNCPHDEAKKYFELPDFITKMVENKWLGSKSGQGFYKKEGKEILALNLNTMLYETSEKVKFPILEQAKLIENTAEKLQLLINDKSKVGEFYRHTFFPLLTYVSHRIPEIADDLYQIDDAMQAGFAWEIPPFKLWDLLGVAKITEQMQQNGHAPAQWVSSMLAKGITSFYQEKNGQPYFYDIKKEAYTPIPGTEKQLHIDYLKADKVIWKNSGVSVIDLGDGIINAEFHTKMNSIGGEVLTGIVKAIEIAEADYKGLIISNNGANFSAGANVGMIFMLAAEQDWDQLNMAVKQFQHTVMRIRYSSIPVVVAPHNLALGGACEVCMHADKVIAHAETYMGLVELGVGVIPAGGGSKEFALRCSDEFKEGDIRINAFRNRFMTIAQAKVSTSAYEAFELGYLRKGIDEIVVSRDLQLSYAKKAALQLWEAGYTQPLPRKNILALGKEAMGIVYVGANSMQSGNYISEYDQKLSEKLGFVMAGGDLSAPTLVSEQYLLDLERKAFVELCAEKKTLERLQNIIQKGKPLRN